MNIILVYINILNINIEFKVLYKDDNLLIIIINNYYLRFFIIRI